MRLIDADALMQVIREHDYPLRGHINSTDNGMFTIGIQQAVDEAPTIDAVPVVRCRECVWWRDRQIQLADGSCRDYMPDEPWSVTCDVGINVGSHCTKHGFDDKSGSWFWAAANDFCSRGVKMEGKV